MNTLRKISGLRRFSSIFFLVLSGMSIAADEPPVKKSTTGICHAKGTTYYQQTKKYETFHTIEDCVKSGGRLPRR